MTPMRLSGWIEDTAAGFAPQIAKSISIRTAFSDETEVINGQEIADILRKKKAVEVKEVSAGSKLMYAIKPTFYLKSPLLGDQTIAPFGEAKPGEEEQNVFKVKMSFGLIIFGLVVTGFALGRALKD